MMPSNTQLKFHETFQPEAKYITKIMELAYEKYAGNKHEISEQTGIPTGKQKGKVEPTIRYASYMGLVCYSYQKGIYSLSLTPLGREVFMQDKYLHEDLSKWICHYGISCVRDGAPQWDFFVNKLHPGFSGNVSQEHALFKANQEFDVNYSAEEMFGVLKRSYTQGFFTNLDYIHWESDIQFVEHHQLPELVFVYAYALYSNWEKLISNRQEATMIEIQDEIGLGKIFGFNNEELGLVLDLLADENLISLNRQLFPATVILTSSTKFIIEQLYTRLL